MQFFHSIFFAKFKVAPVVLFIAYQAQQGYIGTYSSLVS